MDLWLPDVRVAKIAPRLIDKTGRFSSPLSGNIRTVTRPGDRWAFRLDYQSLQGLDQGRQQALIAAQRGAANRVLYSPGDYVQRGSFPSAEILVNNAFTNGLTNWVAQAQITATVQDRLYRATRNANTGTQSVLSNGATAITQYAPHVARAMIQFGRGAAFSPTVAIGTSAFQQDIAASAQLTASGLAVVAAVPSVTLASLSVMDNAGAAMAGDYLSIPFVSLTRCPLVDNGPNLLLNSDTPGGAPWTLSNALAAANGTAAPDGTLSAYYLGETTGNAQHSAGQNVTVASAAQDFTFSVFVFAVNRGWCFLQMNENTGSTGAYAFFNLSTGAVGSTPTAGANWANLRVSPGMSYGGGWWRFTITARKTNAATSLTALLGPATADNVSTYAGVASPVALLTWRASLAVSSVPVRPVQTLGTPATGILQTGSALNLKGLPASINGLLLLGDWVEVNKELKRVEAPLNSDASGLGYLQFSPPLRGSPADNDPVIVNTPIGRFVFSSSENGWASVPGYFATSSLDLVEAA